VVTGPNGSGKTNFLEAVHVGTQGFSPRTRRDARIVRFGSEVARVRTVGTVAAGRGFAVAVTICSGKPKRITVDGALVTKVDDLRRRFPVLAFTPDRLAVVKGGPALRRAYLDRVLGRVLPSRAELPFEYGRALAHRNAALRRTAAGVSTREALAPWDEALARLGTQLDVARREAIEALAPSFAQAGAKLGLSEPVLSYDGAGLSRAELDARLERDLDRGLTGTGPHLRDLAIRSGALELRAFGSQGEQRVAVLALVLAEAYVISTGLGEPPLLLLDDVLSELDERRREALLEAVPAGCQTLLTTTTLRSLPGTTRPELVVDVTAGKVQPR
jgi:DNA replication and repair protein RecF